MKVLIISHLPVSTQSNMGRTFLSLFSQFEKQELCQFYIYPAVPDVDRCASYFRITDKDILASFPFRKKVGGEISHDLISESQGLYESAEDEAIYSNRKNRSPLCRLLRDMMWSMANWYNTGLKVWLSREKPTCIFVAPGTAKFMYNIALKISRELRIPIITYICDEYYFVKSSEKLIERFRLRLLKSKIESLMAHTAHLTVICEELNADYTNKFNVPATTLMTGTNYTVADKPQITDAPTEISYFGNISCNRYISLAEIGRELDSINEEIGVNYKLKIYTPEKDKEILAAFDGINSVELCGFVTGRDFDKAFYESHLLLHTEAFDEDSIDRVRHSVSTKIADSLASGIPLLAYAPAGVSSMKHLERYNCAIMATSKAQLRKMLLCAFTDKQERIRAAEKALTVARTHHDSKLTGLELKKIACKVSKNV